MVPRAIRIAVLLAVTVAGSWIGATLAPSTPAYLGPLTATVRVVPSLEPGVRLLLPPAGQVSFPTHSTPVAVEVRIREVDPDGAREIIDSPAALLALQRTAPDALRSAVIRAGLTTVLFSLAGALALSVLVHRRLWRRTVEVAGLLAAVVATSAGLTLATLTPDALATPKFQGLLSQAPYVAGTASSLLDRLESYRSGLADIVQGVATLYATAGRLPVLADAASEDVVTVLHVSDIHLNPLAYDLIDKLVKQFSVQVVVDTGDVTTWGTPLESELLRRIGSLPVPYVLVRGNHDSEETEQAVAANPNAVVLDGTVAEVEGVVFAGIGDPVFTPAGTVDEPDVPAQARADEPATARPAVPSASVPSPADGPVGSPGPGASPQGKAATSAPVQATDPHIRAGERLAAVIDARSRDNSLRPVTVALVHDPDMAVPLMGHVPLVLAGHLHTRSRQEADGTRLMIEGTTGGAGLTSRGLQRLDDGEPVSMQASVLYLARSGARAGRLVGWDEVTMGGFGLASVSLERHVVRAADDDSDVTSSGAIPTPSGGREGVLSGTGTIAPRRP